VPLAEIHDLVQGNYRRCKFIVAENSFEGLHVKHSAIVEDLSPDISGYFPVRDVPVFKEKHSSALHTGIKKLSNIELRTAFQTAVKHVSTGLRNQIGLHILWKLIDSHGFSFL